MKTIKILTLAIITIIFSACSNDDDSAPAPVNEEEVITTLTATLQPVGGGTAVIIQTRDLDGDGPNAPVITGGTLAANTTYNGTMALLNELEDPADIITTEIQDEDEDHQFFFSATNNVGTIAYTDMDADGNPVGLTFTLTTTAAATGNLTVTLRHEPNKSASGVSAGDITNAGGETDIEATFPITVQ